MKTFPPVRCALRLHQNDVLTLFPKIIGRGGLCCRQCDSTRVKIKGQQQPLCNCPRPTLFYYTPDAKTHFDPNRPTTPIVPNHTYFTCSVQPSISTAIEDDNKKLLQSAITYSTTVRASF